MSSFQGLPPGLFEFFADLKANNTKAFWHANRQRWEHEVRAPMRSLVEVLSDEFGPLRIFRPNRDVRFSADKSPYKLWTGATSESQAAGGIGYYLEVSATSLITGYGAMLMVSDQLHRYRAAIDDDATGIEFEQMVGALAEQSLSVSHGATDPLKTAPRGYSADHPRIQYLRWKGAVIVQEWPKDHWMHSRETLEAIQHTWRGAAPLKAWLETHVSQPTRSHD